MLTSVAAETGTSELAPNSSITVEEITMALETIAGVARATWRLSRVAIAARVGAVAKGDIKLCVAVGGHEWRDIITAAEFTISSIKSNATFLKSALELMRAAVARREGST
jgi:molybdopterin synthase catalytic subunit